MLICIVVFCGLVWGSVATTSTFLSRPDIKAPLFDIRSINPSLSSPGFWFFSPWGGSSLLSPYIFDNHGELIWSGHSPELGDMRAWDLRVFELANKSSRLSMFRGSELKGHGYGHIVLLDDAYKVQKTFGLERPGSSLDFHDFQLLQGGRTAIILKYVPAQCDLSAHGLNGLGWVFDGVFQEIEVETGNVVFEWHSIDHVSVNESTITAKIKEGAGRTYFFPFDYFHINSVEKYPNGDYLISARHADCIYRISHTDGSVIWKLGGVDSSFILDGFNFSAQHDARLRTGPGGKEQISFYNNAWSGETASRNYSSAFLIELDPLSFPMKATLIKEWFPSKGGLARHQGNVQYLPNGNIFIGWGGIPEFSEFTPDGNRVLDVAFADPETLNYRIWKHSWVGRPDTLPDLYMYARSKSDVTQYYMSWNGATEVDAWNIYQYNSADTLMAPVLISKIAKQGFETQYSSSDTILSGFIEALDINGQVLARSDVKVTFIPPEAIAPYCSVTECSARLANNTSPELGNKDDIETTGQARVRVKMLAGWYRDSSGSVGIKGRLQIATGTFTLLLVGYLVGRLSNRPNRPRRKMKDLYIGAVNWALTYLQRQQPDTRYIAQYISVDQNDDSNSQ